MAVCWAAVIVCGGSHLLGRGSRLLCSCRRLAARVVCSGGGCVTWHGEFVGPWQSFVVQLSSFGSQGCLQWWGLCDVAWGQCVEVVVVGS